MNIGLLERLTKIQAGRMLLGAEFSGTNVKSREG